MFRFLVGPLSVVTLEEEGLEASLYYVCVATWLLDHLGGPIFRGLALSKRGDESAAVSRAYESSQGSNPIGVFRSSVHLVSGINYGNVSL